MQSEKCKECGGKCCTNPFLTTEEYMRLYAEVGDQKMMAANPKFIPAMNGWIFQIPAGEKCPGVTETGCILPYEDRPKVCRTYPFLGYKAVNGHALLLAVKTCPAWEEFGSRYQEAYAEYEKLCEGEE